MPIKTRSVEYKTVVVGGAYLVKNILHRLGVVAAIDQALTAQPEIAATYGLRTTGASHHHQSPEPPAHTALPNGGLGRTPRY